MYFIEADPGERVTETLIIKNSTTFVPTFTSEAFDMVASRDEGSRAFEYVPVGEAPRGAGAWVEPIRPERITIPAREQVELDLVIDVPDDAGAGGHYAGITFTADDPRTDTAVRFQVVNTVPIFITVSGDFERDVRVQATPTDRWHWNGGSIAWDVRVSNEGDVAEPFSGRLTIDGLLGGASSQRLDAGILFPGEERTQRLEFDVRSAPDLLRGRARVDLDDAPSPGDDAARVVVLPWWVLVLLALAVLVVVVRLRTRGRRSAGPDAGECSSDDDWIEPAG